jgi:hypothetical protein
VRARCGLQSTEAGKTKARHVYGANCKREPHNNVQDRAQKNFPSNGIAGHTPSFCLLWGANTLLLSLGMSPFCCSKSSQSSQFPPGLEIYFDCASSRFLSWRIGEGIAMWADIAGILVALSIAILIAHAFDAFRSG